MARRKKKNPKMKTFLKFFIIIIFAVSLIYGIYDRTVFFFKNAGIFDITEIVKSPSLQFVESRNLSRLEGKNIFSIDLKGVQRRIQSEYPSVDRLRIVRQLPNRILVTAEKRDPFVIVSMGSQEVVLDEHGVVLGGEVPSRGILPYISGTGEISAVSKGRKFSNPRINAGLKIIQAVRMNEYLNHYAIQSIDVSNLSKIQLYLSNIEVIVDRFKIDEKIETLGLLLSDAGIPIEQLNYLDLRFKEPIINKK